MTKEFCDRCGAEQKNNFHSLKFKKYIICPDTDWLCLSKRVCENCYNEFIQWYNEGVKKV